MSMNNTYITNWRNLEYRGYRRFLQNWDWEWLVTLTFPERTYRHYSRNAAKADLLRWTRQLCTSEHIQVCYYYALCYICGHPHFHLLMIGRGRSGREVKSLHDVSPSKWARRWDHIAKIEVPDSISSVSKYLAAHKLRFKCDRADIDSYNQNLLKQLRLPPPI